MKAAALYLFAAALFLAFCLALHFLDEFRGDRSRSNDGAGDGECLNHDGGDTI